MVGLAVLNDKLVAFPAPDTNRAATIGITKPTGIVSLAVLNRCNINAGKHNSAARVRLPTGDTGNIVYQAVSNIEIFMGPCSEGIWPVGINTHIAAVVNHAVGNRDILEPAAADIVAQEINTSFKVVTYLYIVDVDVIQLNVVLQVINEVNAVCTADIIAAGTVEIQLCDFKSCAVVCVKTIGIGRIDSRPAGTV